MYNKIYMTKIWFLSLFGEKIVGFLVIKNDPKMAIFPNFEPLAVAGYALKR